MVAYPEAPSLQVPVALGHQQHQLCLRSTQVKVHQPRNIEHVYLIKSDHKSSVWKNNFKRRSKQAFDT